VSEEKEIDSLGRWKRTTLAEAKKTKKSIFILALVFGTREAAPGVCLLFCCHGHVVSLVDCTLESEKV